MYADITQITTHQGKSRALQADNTRRELERVNNYEKQWKIKTSLPKFTVIPLCGRKTHPLVTNNAQIEYKSRGTLLGLHISTTGYSHYVHTRKEKARELRKLYRFQALPEKIKLRLVTSLIIPILTYPAVPLHTMSTTQILKLQVVQMKP